MKGYGFPLIISLSVLMLGCDDHQVSVEEAPEVKVIEEPVPVNFSTLPNGEYKITLKQTNTKTTSMSPRRVTANRKPVVIESYSEWLLHHQDDSYRFELVDIRYSYKLQLYSLIFDTRWSEVIAESNVPGYHVEVAENSEHSVSAALEKLKTIKGFSFSLGKNADATENMFSLTSSYQLPSESLKIEDNIYSPHEEIGIHLGEKKIVPIFSLMMAHPLKPMSASETYKSTTGIWELSAGANRLAYKKGDGGTSISVVNHFDHSNSLINSYFKGTKKAPARKIKYREVEIEVTDNYVHEAEVVLRAVDMNSTVGS